MPLPSDQRIVTLAQDLLKQFDAMFGSHPGYRAVHAKGAMLSGEFTPSPGAATLTRAPHASRKSTPVTVRFSDSTGLPAIPDNSPDASPHGCAIRFHLDEHVHTDIVSHSVDAFPARTGQEFLELLRAIASGNPSAFLASHPAALAFVQAPKPDPVSFATESYFAVTAYRFINPAGAAHYGRYRIVPAAGAQPLDSAAARLKEPDYLFDEISRRVAAGPIRFRIEVQVAQDGDVVDDATIHWPQDRPLVHLGDLVLTSKAPDDEAHRRIIFDPLPRVDGIEPSADPLLELRAAIYLLSGRRRRAAAEQKKTSA